MIEKWKQRAIHMNFKKAVIIFLKEIHRYFRLSWGDFALLAALFFNLAAVAALYLYGFLKGTCANCGRIRSGNGRFCGGCGSPLKRECPQCGQEIDASSAYCSNCGQKLQEDQETEK